MVVGVFLHIGSDIYSKTEPLAGAKSIGRFKVSQHICMDSEEENPNQEGYCSGIAYDEKSDKFLLFIDENHIADIEKILAICSIPSAKVERLNGTYNTFYRKLLKKHYGSLYYEFRDILH